MKASATFKKNAGRVSSIRLGHIEVGNEWLMEVA